MNLLRSNRIKKVLACLLFFLVAEIYIQPFFLSIIHKPVCDDGCCHTNSPAMSCCMVEEEAQVASCSDDSYQTFDLADNCGCIIEANPNLDFIVFDGKVNINPVYSTGTTLLNHSKLDIDSYSAHFNKNLIASYQVDLLEHITVLLI